MRQESFCNIAAQTKTHAHVAELVDASRLRSGHSQGCEGAKKVLNKKVIVTCPCGGIGRRIPIKIGTFARMRRGKKSS